MIPQLPYYALSFNAKQWQNGNFHFILVFGPNNVDRMYIVKDFLFKLEHLISIIFVFCVIYCINFLQRSDSYDKNFEGLYFP